ncbi:penicillin-binding protein 2 [Candidatus Liberibacter sp.]|uniref:peptidoglycan D,D-transpeptidase FtsI family protein n=1 Tax=Candidatus Liberibacter sp. TaxID=34022 RepID=UPI0021750F48|nr:penicillin-binding protein 2 [Candidatus Liberibacter sp.]
MFLPINDTNLLASGENLFQIQHKKITERSKNRILIIILAFISIYIVLGWRLLHYGFLRIETIFPSISSESYLVSRPDILDRNGEILATDIKMVSLYAEPYRIINPDEVIQKLLTVLPNLDVQTVRRKLSSKSRFQWLRRQLTPKQQNYILNLGIPGLGFRPEKRRFYPSSSVTSHVVGYVNVDNRGMAGMEKFIDMQGLLFLPTTKIEEIEGQVLKPIKLSLDLRVQAMVHEVLTESKIKYQAESAGAVILNVLTGEIIAMVSIPDYDPNKLIEGKTEGWLNRISNGTFEMGSTFKAFTIAMGLDSGLLTINDSLDARYPIKEGKYFIKDFHAQRRLLTVSEIFQYSSNIGAAKIADIVGINKHQEFLHKLGLLTKLETELPEVKTPTQPIPWKKIHSLTASFGHGIATTPLQTAVSAIALVNGGRLIPPTFLVRSREEASKVSRIVLKKSTSDSMVSLLRQGVINGSGRRAFVPGFEVGGKTGTAQKVIDGRYSDAFNFNSFLGIFPISNPRYVVLSFIDSPKIGEKNQLTAGMNAAPVVGEIIRRSAAILGVKPVFKDVQRSPSIY